MSHVATRVALISLLAVGGVRVATAHDLAGAAMPPLVLEDVAARRRTLEFDANSLPVVLVWEDDESSKQKQAAHAVVGRYSDNAENRAVFELIAVADMGRWSWWPARKYALAAIKKKVANAGTGVWIDWQGALRKAFSLKQGQSAFLVVGADGHVRWFGQGQLDGERAQALDAAIAGLGAKPARGR